MKRRQISGKTREMDMEKRVNLELRHRPPSEVSKPLCCPDCALETCPGRRRRWRAHGRVFVAPRSSAPRPNGSVLKPQPRVPPAPPGLRIYLPTDGRRANDAQELNDCFYFQIHHWRILARKRTRTNGVQTLHFCANLRSDHPRSSLLAFCWKQQRARDSPRCFPGFYTRVGR